MALKQPPAIRARRRCDSLTPSETATLRYEPKRRNGRDARHKPAIRTRPIVPIRAHGTRVASPAAMPRDGSWALISRRLAPPPPPSAIFARRRRHHRRRRHLLPRSVRSRARRDHPQDEEKQENESWEHAEPKYVAIFAKGMLASIFIAVSMYITVAGASTMEPSYYVLKWLMTILCWLLTIPALYSTTLIVLTFFAVARDTVAKELGMKRPTYIVAIMGLVMLVVLPFTLPLIIVLGPILDQCEGTLPIRDFWLVVVGLIDFVQTLVLIPLGYVVIWASECPTDVFINIVVVQARRRRVVSCKPCVGWGEGNVASCRANRASEPPPPPAACA